MIWRSVVGKLWLTIIALVAVILITLGLFLMQYVDNVFSASSSHEIKVLFVYVGVIGFLLTTFFAFFLITKITQPLVRLKEAADQIAQGKYGIRVPIRSNDEIGELANTFNNMGTELEELIKDLQHEKEHLSSVLRSMADAVVTFDASGRVILTNPQGQELLAEWSELDWTEEAEPDYRPFGEVPVPLYELYRTVLREGRDSSGKLHVRDGVWSVVMAPLTSNQSVRGAVAVLREVTEEFRLEKLRRDFVANVSHEIRTPLSMLQGYSEALLDDIAASPEERGELVQVIHDESLRMGRLVKDLLDLARMEAGHLEMQLREVEMNGLIQRVHRKFQVYAKERGIRLFYTNPAHPLLLQAADEDRLEQVLTNLLDNALRHTPAEAGIYITLSETTQDDKPYAQVTVRDEGQGVPREDLPYIFERFYKADKARTRASGGTGLGLAIVRNIIEAHRGEIGVASTPGEGTTFTLLLPVEAPWHLSEHGS
ncbi:HAMP domain-containing protein [Paenibacillus sp. IB182496]|uniref:histidine kinase n=1 Tax=Paenibacillus sabuli TaxID=2772509 RepID=A0A927BWI4_9BACL|nr:ATP-binding protein [Paenibacillus sabuli]MBD2846799.1 HAMP domain-containing protein [Paenibacillus sabuli]